jgi:hypothetical protein
MGSKMVVLERRIRLMTSKPFEGRYSIKDKPSWLVVPVIKAADLFPFIL